MKTLILISVAFVILLIFLAFFFLTKPSPTGVYHCTCNIPGYGEKEALVTVQILGEEWGAKVLYPTNITLNIFGYSVPCNCRTV